MTPVLLFILFVSVTAIPQHARNNEITEVEEPSSDITEVITRANKAISTKLIHGDIRRSWSRNADPCTARGCLWQKTGRYVIVPVSISSTYSVQQRNIIIRALLTFHKSTCIRFVWRRSWHQNYLSFFSGSGCWSYVGRQGRGQAVSLLKDGCLYTGTIQHEVLHALGFHHEQVRSDRDQHVSILTENIQPGAENNFRKVATNNLKTPYDFQSVMHYSNFAFSRNGKRTIVAKINPNLSFGGATEMSANDIDRVNALYQCSN